MIKEWKRYAPINYETNAHILRMCSSWPRHLTALSFYDLSHHLNHRARLLFPGYGNLIHYTVWQVQIVFAQKILKVLFLVIDRHYLYFWSAGSWMLSTCCVQVTLKNKKLYWLKWMLHKNFTNNDTNIIMPSSSDSAKRVLAAALIARRKWKKPHGGNHCESQGSYYCSWGRSSHTRSETKKYPVWRIANSEQSESQRHALEDLFPLTNPENGFGPCELPRYLVSHPGNSETQNHTRKYIASWKMTLTSWPLLMRDLVRPVSQPLDPERCCIV